MQLIRPGFTLRSRVDVSFAAIFDAGALVLWQDDEHGTSTPSNSRPGFGDDRVEVTKGQFDDCNSTVITASHVWLRVARNGGVNAFHYCEDASIWNLARVFRLNSSGSLLVGFEAQWPYGKTTTAQFSKFQLTLETLEDLRDGS